MANPKHLQNLKKGAIWWNEWKAEHNYLKFDLSGADLTETDLRGINLSRVCLKGANLEGANLSPGFRSNPAFGDTRGSYYPSALIRTDLSGANLKNANLRSANLGSANLDKAILLRANLASAFLEKAHFNSADIRFVDFGGASVAEADFTGATLDGTKLTDVDLSEVKGLDTVIHGGPSSIGIDTLFQSKGQIPEKFLHNCGVPDEFITYARSLVSAGKVLHFYSCFISYSSRDQEFAERLHADLQAKGVRVWFAPHDMPIGARIRPTIDESIRVYDKLLLVLSEHSVSSQWVEQEVETALRKERQGGGTVLFPVRLDDTVFEMGEGWPALVKDTRHVGDFTRWKDHDSYRKAFERLLRDLKAGA